MTLEGGSTETPRRRDRCVEDPRSKFEERARSAAAASSRSPARIHIECTDIIYQSDQKRVEKGKSNRVVITLRGTRKPGHGKKIRSSCSNAAMQLSRFSSCGLLTILVFWLNVNDAVTSVLRPAAQVQRTTSSVPNTAKPDTTRGQNYGNDVKDSRINSSSRKSRTDDSAKKWDVPRIEKNAKGKCANEARRENQTYTRSIPKSSSDPADDFKIAGEAEARKTSSVHRGEEIAICWIETTTIKEDPSSNPPARLVIREFTITFENSASIPDSYLECNELEGEISPGDEETVRKSALQEVIDENTKNSRELNFTRVNHMDGIVVYQHRKVKCGVGAVVTKNIFEWPDGTENPKKRVEIQVGPSIRDLSSAAEEEPGECVSKSVPKMPKSGQMKSSSPGCTSGNCSEPTTGKTDGKPLENSTERNVPTTRPRDTNEVLSTGVIRTTTMRSIRKTLSSLPEDVLCLEDDVDCIASKITTTKPGIDAEIAQNCSGFNCSGGSTDRSTLKVACDPSKNASCLCSGKNCSSTEQSTSDTKDFTEMTTNINELCKNGSESSSCSIHRYKNVTVPQNADKKTEETTIVSVNEGSEKATEFSKKSSTSRSTRQKDSRCDGDSEECSVSSQSDFDDTADGNGRNRTTPFGKNSSDKPSRKQQGVIEVPDVAGTTKNPGVIGNASKSLNGTSCGESASGGCSTVIPGSNNSSVGFLSESTEPNERRRPSACNEDDESCKSAVTSDKFVPVSKPFDATIESTAKSSELEPTLPISEKPVVFPNRVNDEVTGTPIAKTDLKTGPSKPKAESNEGGTLLDEESSVDDSSSSLCSVDSESSADCSRNIRNSTATPSTSLADTRKKSLSSGKTGSPSQSCESSENCESTGETSESDETNLTVLADAGLQKQITSSCDDITKSCESPASLSDISETCEDGSTDCRSEKVVPMPKTCDTSSSSCSLEVIDVETTSKSTPKGLEISSAINTTVATTAETRRSMGLTTPQSPPVKGPHRLALRIKVLLEHIDENKEREQLVQVERNLLLHERPDDHGNHSLTFNLQTLNNSMNFQTLKDILNCTVLENLSKDAIDLDKLSKDVINATEAGRKAEGRVSSRKTMVDPSIGDSANKADDVKQYSSVRKSEKNSDERKKREILKPGEPTMRTANVNDSSTEKAILKCLPGVQDDLKNGVDRALARVAKELDGPATTALNATTKSSSKILKILSDPSDGRVHSKRPKRATRVERTVLVRQLRSPVNGEEIERWSNERFISAADGGQIRSLTEFRVLRDHSEDHRT